MGSFRYFMNLYRQSEVQLDLVASVPVPVERFQPVLEWLQFQAVRHGKTPPHLGGEIPWEAEPIWDSALGDPFVSGVGMSIRAETGAKSSPVAAAPLESCDLDVDYFKSMALDAVVVLARTGKLTKGDRTSYRILALAGEDQASKGEALTAEETEDGYSGDGFSGGGFTVEEIEQVLPVQDASMDAFLEGARACDEPGPEDMPVFLPQEILDEVLALKAEADGVETGGILVGRLHCDSVRSEIFAEVTAQIPARHTRAGAVSLEFTKETWTAVQDAIDLRGNTEIMVGWWHSHVARTWCKECDAECLKKCPLAQSFFSTSDSKLHQVVFPRAYSVALVVGDAVGDTTENITTENNTEGGELWRDYHAMYGWNRGLLKRRGFHIIGSEVISEMNCPEPDPVKDPGASLSKSD